MELGIRGRRGLVTGASRGIGRGIARTLAAEGVNLALVARDVDALDALADELASEFDIQCVGIAADLAQVTGIEHATREAESGLGGIDMLINNAGAIPAGTLDSVSDEDLVAAWDLKLLGYIRLARVLVGPMRERGWGRVINVIGLAGKQPSAGYIWGGPANAALMNFTKGLAQTVAGDGIRVNAINPGPIATERWTTMLEVAAKRSGRPLDEIIKGAASSVPLGRVGEVDEIADLVAFLCSERAGFLHGAVIPMDGGMCAAL